MKAKKSSASSKKKSVSSSSPRMSVSPQSLARTRDKRSLKIPARFNDTEFAFRDVAEALRMKGRATPSVPNTKNSSSSSTTSSTSTTPATTPAPSAQSANATPRPPTTTTTTPTAATITTTETTTTTVASEPTPINTDTLPTKDDNLSKLANSLGFPEGEVAKVWNTAFRPSVKFTRVIKANLDDAPLSTVGQVKPLVEQIPNSLPSTNTSDITVQDKSNHINAKRDITPSSSTRKKSKGFSLIVKQHQQQQQQQQQNDTNYQYNNSNITIQPVSGPVAVTAAHQLAPHQQARQFNGAQYGTRILLNEPIYLPRSVGNIAPITATLPQIANQARKPPFVSKKAEAYLKYQDDRKLNYLASMHTALVKITRYLGVKDKLNLRCVNKTWKSIIDSDSVWLKVLVTENDFDISWKSLVKNFLKSKLTDVIFDGYVPTKTDIPPHKLGKYLGEELGSLQKVWIKSVNRVQNTVALDIIQSFEDMYHDNETKSNFQTNGKIYWQVGVGVDAIGIATVELIESIHSEDQQGCYDDDVAIMKTVELYDLEKELLDRRKATKNGMTYVVQVKPI